MIFLIASAIVFTRPTTCDEHKAEHTPCCSDSAALVFDPTPSGANLTAFGAKWWSGEGPLENTGGPPTGNNGCFSQGMRDKCADYVAAGSPGEGWPIPKGWIDVFLYDYGWGIPLHDMGLCETSWGYMPFAHPIAICSAAFKIEHFSGMLAASVTERESVRSSLPITPTSEVVLFDGTTLAGWRHSQLGFARGDDPFHLFRVKEGTIEVSFADAPHGMYSVLCTEESYTMYELGFEFQFFGGPHVYTPTYKWGWIGGEEDSAGVNSGVFLHSDTNGNNRNVEVNLKEFPLFGFTYILGEWYTGHVRVDGNASTTAEITGNFGGAVATKTLPGPGFPNAFSYSEQEPQHGSICLQNEMHPIRFRNLKLNPL